MKIKMNCPYCKKEIPGLDHTPVQVCMHCLRSFRKKGAVPYQFDGSPFANYIVTADIASGPDYSVQDHGSTPDTPDSSFGGGGGEYGGGGASGDF